MGGGDNLRVDVVSFLGLKRERGFRCVWLSDSCSEPVAVNRKRDEQRNILCPDLHEAR